jgi:type III pantothenate kinase
MKVLAIDAGNTRIKWAVNDAGGWSHEGWAPTADGGDLDDAFDAVAAVDRIVIANVAGLRVHDGLARSLARFGTVPHWLTASAACCGVRSGYAHPERLGADRWAALIGARVRHAGPCIIANAGTTLTVDALSDEGVFLGGCIVPGVPLMQDALDRNTAQLVRREGRFAYFPDNTADAIASGAVNALAGVVDRMLSYLQQITGAQPLVVLSGGAAETLAPHLAHRVERVPALVLEGLLAVALERDRP